MPDLPLSYGLGTHAIHVGEGEDSLGAHVARLYQTSTFVLDSPEDYGRINRGEKTGFIYSRTNNPNTAQAERKLAALEGLALQRRGVEVAARVFASGMAAISSAVLARAPAGSHVLVQDQLYGSTHGFFHQLLPNYGVTASHFDPHQPGALEAGLQAHSNTRLIFIETPANPTLKVVDIGAVAEAAHAWRSPAAPDGAWVMVDNTFATPWCQRPLELGADIAVHSTTKYLSGHGLIIAGAAVSHHTGFIRSDLGAVMRYAGPTASPFESWLLNLGLKTFHLRMERHCANALAVARYLQGHPAVTRVLYPGLPGHPQHDVAARQMPGGFGGMLSFELAGGLEAGRALMQRLRLCALAVSLGNVDSMIQHPAGMTHYFVPPEERLAVGITDGLVRLSVGVEDLEDILDDLERGLSG
jgi:methionine-gamma-lyase